MIRQRLFFGVAAAVFVLDVVLAAPGVTWFDGGEFVAGVGSMGVTHPPGQPAYMVLAKIASLLPAGSLAFRLSLFSAACAAAAAGVLAVLVSRATARLAGHPEGDAPLAGGVAGLLLGLSPALTLQGVRPELYSLALLLGLLAALAVQRGGRRGLALAVVPLCVAGAVHHAMLAAAVPGFVLLALGRGRGSLRSAVTVTVLLLPTGLLQFLWLPLRSLTHPELDAGVPRTLERVIMAATGASWAGSYRLEAGQLVDNLVEHAGIFLADLGPFAVVMGLLGLGWLVWREKPKPVIVAGVFFIAGIAPTALQSVFFPENPDVRGYLLGPMAVCAAAAGVGVWAVVRTLEARTGYPALIGGVLLVATVMSPLARSTVVADRRGLHSPSRLSAELLHEATPGALVLLGGDSWLMPALAAQIWDRRRPDLVVVGLHSLDELGLPDLAARTVAIPTRWSADELRAFRGARPGLQHEHALRAIARRNPSVDIFVNDFFVPPELLGRREPHGFLLRLHRASGSPPPPSPDAEERRLGRQIFEVWTASPGWGLDHQGRAVLARRDLARAGLYLQRGHGDLALRLLKRGGAAAPSPWDFVHLARHRLETGADVPGPWASDTEALAAAEALVDGDLEAARRGVEAVLGVQPTHPVALLTAGRLYTLGHPVSTAATSP